jgi:hypothetical protein
MVKVTRGFIVKNEEKKKKKKTYSWKKTSPKPMMTTSYSFISNISPKTIFIFEK